MADGTGRKPRDSKPLFNNFFNIMMETSGIRPHFRREIINTIDTIKSAELYGHTFFVFFDSKFTAYQSTTEFDSIFYDVNSVISNKFNSQKTKDKLKALDHFSSDYEDQFKKIKQTATNYVLDMFEECQTLEELRQHVESTGKIKWSDVLTMLKESYNHFGFEKYDETTFDNRQEKNAKRELFIYNCSKLVLVSVEALWEHYNPGRVMSHTQSANREIYDKFLNDLK
jgi:hypothetical protein